MGAAGTWVVGDSGPHGGDGDVIGAAGVAGAAGGLGQEEGEQAAEQAMARALESGSSEEDSDIGPADEGEENMSGHRNLVMDARQFPMVGFRFIFLDLVHSLLYRIYYNHHILVRPRGGRVQMQVGPRMAQGMAQLPALPLLEGPGESAMAQEPEGPGEGATAQEPEDQPDAEAEAKEQPAAEEEPTQEAAAWEGEEQAPGSRRPQSQGGSTVGGQRGRTGLPHSFRSGPSTNCNAGQMGQRKSPIP